MQASNAQRTAQSVTSQVYNARGQTLGLVGQVSQVRSQSDTMYSRAQVAARRAGEAVGGAVNVTNEARNMLDVMRNFDTKAQGIQPLSGGTFLCVILIPSF